MRIEVIDHGREDCPGAEATARQAAIARAPGSACLEASVLGMVRTLGAIASVEPSRKVALLRRGIEESHEILACALDDPVTRDRTRPGHFTAATAKTAEKLQG